MRIKIRRESSSALRFKLRRGCGADGDHMPTQPAAAEAASAMERLGEPGNNEAVCPSSPIPSRVTSNGRGMRAKVSQAETAPKSGEGAAFLRPAKRASAACSLSSTSRTIFSLLPGSLGSTQRSSASAMHTRRHSIGLCAKLFEEFDRRPAAGNDQAGPPRASIARASVCATSAARACASSAMAGNRLNGCQSSSCQENPSRLIRALDAAGPQLPAM